MPRVRDGHQTATHLARDFAVHAGHRCARVADHYQLAPAYRRWTSGDRARTPTYRDWAGGDHASPSSTALDTDPIGALPHIATHKYHYTPANICKDPPTTQTGGMRRELGPVIRQRRADSDSTPGVISN